jgi:hypothetical protein
MSAKTGSTIPSHCKVMLAGNVAPDHVGLRDRAPRAGSPPRRRRVVGAMRNRLALVVLLAAQASALVFGLRLHTPEPLDWRRPRRWLDRASPEDVLLAAGRLVLIVVAAWLLLSTVAAIALRLASGRSSGAPPYRPRALQRVVPAFVQRVVEGAVVVSVLGGASAPPVMALVGHDRRAPVAARLVLAPLAPVRDGRVAAVPAPAPEVGPVQPAVPAPSAPAPRPVEVPGRARHVVAPGESLWTIAEARVRATTHDDPATVERYWRAVCEVNRERLRSGDVNVVHPGEDLDLPPVA